MAVPDTLVKLINYAEDIKVVELVNIIKNMHQMDFTLSMTYRIYKKKSGTKNVNKGNRLY